MHVRPCCGVTALQWSHSLAARDPLQEGNSKCELEKWVVAESTQNVLVPIVQQCQCQVASVSRWTLDARCLGYCKWYNLKVRWISCRKCCRNHSWWNLDFSSSLFYPGVLVAAANSVGWSKIWEEALEARNPLGRLPWANRSSSLGWWVSKVTQLIPSLFPHTKHRHVAVHCFNVLCFTRNMHYPDSMCTLIRRRSSKYECGRSGLLVIVWRGQLDRTFTVLRLLYL